MGGGAMGKLEPNQKYVVVVEVYGSKSVDDAKRFNAELDRLIKEFGARVRYSAHATKQKEDPSS
jgi:hypothetical protein